MTRTKTKKRSVSTLRKSLKTGRTPHKQKDTQSDRAKNMRTIKDGLRGKKS